MLLYTSFFVASHDRCCSWDHDSFAMHRLLASTALHPLDRSSSFTVIDARVRETVLLYTLTLSDPDRVIPMPELSMTLDATTPPADTSMKMAELEFVKKLLTTTALMHPSSHQNPGGVDLRLSTWLTCRPE